VTEAELARIHGMVDEKNAEYKTPIKVGDYATVLDGSFKGSEGKIIEVNEKKGTLKLTVNLLGRDTPVELEFGQIKVKH